MAKPININAPPPREPFEWLRDPRNRRSALREVRTAIRRGWLDTATPEHRAALMAELVALLDGDDLPTRHFFGVTRIMLTMDQADRETRWAQLRLELRARRANRPQSPGRKRG